MHEHTTSQRNQAAILSSRAFGCLLFGTLLFCFCATGFGDSYCRELPGAIRAIMEKPRYSGATWALRVVDVKSGAVIYDLNSYDMLLTGSVRKLYSVAVTLNELGADYRFKTPVFRQG